jgi:hypothetical protein
MKDDERWSAVTLPSTPGRPGMVPLTLDKLGVPVASYRQYAEAQRAVDYLSDQQFPVEHTAIVGRDVHLVEKVVGRLTTGKAALAGLASGAWLGLLIGVLLTLFSDNSFWKVLLAGLAIGALWGAVFGAVGHAATRGQRDFASRSALLAGVYDILVEPSHAARAQQMLATLGGAIPPSTGDLGEPPSPA